MESHKISKVILKQFQSENRIDCPVFVMDKATREIRPRGITHNIFKGPSNYLGDGHQGTLENELAINDESSIPNILEIIRSDIIIDEYFTDLKYLLGNNSAKNPHIRQHPGVKEYGKLTTEEFHRYVMNNFPSKYLHFPIFIVLIKVSDLSFVLPDFSLKHIVLAPDIAIVRMEKGIENNKIAITQDCQYHYVNNLNNLSLSVAKSWVVSKTDKLLQSLGGIPYKQYIEINTARQDKKTCDVIHGPTAVWWAA